MNLYLDVETVPTQKPELVALATKRALAKWGRDPNSRMPTDDEIHAATALDAAFGELAVIGVATDDREPKTYARDMHESEADMLRAFRSDLKVVAARGVRLIGLNVLGFDRNFIRQRGIVHGLSMPPLITAEVKPWEKDMVCDLMTLWTNDNRGRVSLDVLCAALGLPGKEGVDGSMVWDMVKAGRIAEVAAYCADDVRKTRACFLRMTTLDAGTA